MPERAKAVSVPEAEKWLGLFYQGSDLKLGHLLETFFFLLWSTKTSTS
jgi:hypothetical protein